MADPVYPIPQNPVYNPEIRALQDNDPGRASTVFNPLIQALINNIHALYLGAAMLGADGKIKCEQLPDFVTISEDEPAEPGIWFQVLRVREIPDEQTVTERLSTIPYDPDRTYHVRTDETLETLINVDDGSLIVKEIPSEEVGAV